jgi:molecular chaperone DnaK
LKYVGIDLGTTNSVICSYDGENVALYKSPDQKDVTPSALFFDKRGNKYVGSRAYDQAALNPANAAILFKRFMGTSTPINLPGVDKTLTPEECSAEVLKMLFSYLPEEIRNSDESGTVITVPAAFNQMQKDATLNAAQTAGLGRVALMQEPVAAVMSVMKSRKADGMFLVFDLGGGTLDVAIAESTAGRVNLLSHGGIPMCGGRDFDRAIFDNVIKPWINETFDLPDDWITDQKFSRLRNLATWAGEKAKIELSQKESTFISAPETDVRLQDNSGQEIYLDIPLERSQVDSLINEKLTEAIQSTRETLEKVGLTPHDIERVVFVGGPTQYKPLRDKVAFELGIASSTDVNPMTAVAEGAAIFAESLDWASESKGRKSSRGSVGAEGLGIFLNFVSRTPSGKAKLAVKLSGSVAPGSELQVDSLDTGWSSGKVALRDGATLDLPLAKAGDNRFKVFVFDPAGGAIKLPQDVIVISRTAASVDAIPASHSVGIEVRERVGGAATLDYLVKEGDQLPKKGKKTFKSAESLRAGAADAIRFKLWEGEIRDPITDNNFVGVFSIRGGDFAEGVIAAGAELICEYEVSDSGAIYMNVTVPSIGGAFESGRNFYSRQEAQVDYSEASHLLEEDVKSTMDRLDSMSIAVSDPRLEEAREKLASASNAVEEGEALTPEEAKQAADRVLEAKRLMALSRKNNLEQVRSVELEKSKSFFDEHMREHARPSEISSADNLYRSAKRVVSKQTGEFEALHQELRETIGGILWRLDWYVLDRFQKYKESPQSFSDKALMQQLIVRGDAALSANDMETLKQVVYGLAAIRLGTVNETDMFSASNIVRG